MHRKRFTLPVLAAAMVAALAAGCAGENDPAAETTTAAEAEFNDADVTFAQQMIPHHAQAVEMAELVRSGSPELLELADDIEAAQQPEIEQLTAMLEEWGEAVPADEDEHAGHGAGDMEGMMSDEDMTALRDASGVQFEQLWLTMMIEHHEGAITMAEAELADGVNDEARELAQQIIETQQAEIDQMEQLADN